MDNPNLYLLDLHDLYHFISKFSWEVPEEPPPPPQTYTNFIYMHSIN